MELCRNCEKGAQMYAYTSPAQGMAPSVLIAHPDVSYRTAVAWYLRELDWKVTATDTADSLREWARALHPDIVLVASRLPDETGFLACAKLKLEFPQCRVLMLGEKLSAEDARFAQFVGAESLIRRGDGVQKLAEQLLAPAEV